eukprot:CAMPEP_0117444238 /NCGR_PEP_ID=MMETSP0759-20121206/5130_1 /TAXON_ID=63605 /ORGANISM="Percolomonas cosmopolitus, Strain WS" /LENGTH=1083 /DNA_ID=CAMNT_0005236283 /DNA_START=1051 /DNA_END=4303 /DNA_ORIENTATION=+
MPWDVASNEEVPSLVSIATKGNNFLKGCGYVFGFDAATRMSNTCSHLFANNTETSVNPPCGDLVQSSTMLPNSLFCCSSPSQSLTGTAIDASYLSAMRICLVGGISGHSIAIALHSDANCLRSLPNYPSSRLPALPPFLRFHRFVSHFHTHYFSQTNHESSTRQHTTRVPLIAAMPPSHQSQPLDPPIGHAGNVPHTLVDHHNNSIPSSVQKRPQIQKMKRVSFLRRFRALCLLQVHIQRRKYLQNICLIVFPLIVLFLPIVVSIISFAFNQIENGIGLPQPARQTSDGTFINLFKSNYDCCGGVTFHQKSIVCKGKEPMPFDAFSGDIDDYLVVDHTPVGDDSVGQGPFSRQNATGFLENVPRFASKREYLVGHSIDSFCGYGPTFQASNVSGTEELLSKLYTSSSNYETCVSNPFLRWNHIWELNCTSPEFVGHGVLMQRLKTDSLKMEATLVSDKAHVAMRNLMSGFIEKVISPTGNTTFSPRLGSWISVHMSLRFSLAAFADITMLFLYPIVGCFLMPIFTSALIEDRNLGVLQFMELYGVTVFDETLIRCISDMLLYLVYMFVNHIFGALCQILIFQYSWWMLLLINPLYGYIQMMGAYTIAPLFKQPGQATVLGYLVLLIACCVGSLLNMLLFTAQSLPPWWYLIFPPFTYIRCIALAIFNYNQFGYVQPGLSQFFICLAIMVAQAVVLTLTASGLLTVLPKRLFFHLTRVYHRISSTPGEKTPLLSNVLSPDDVVGDDEVLREKRRIQQCQYTEDDVLVVDGLRKEFGYGKRKKVAVNNLYFSAKRGSCTGLIGANGSGKTTTTNMITGYLRATTGTAYVCGYDINSQIHHVKKCIGVLPQFEVLFPTLTVQEHILFYSRLRGLPFGQEKQHVKDILAEIGLEEARRRQARNLSGGMRRRLGLAIALAGSPPLLLLDEPSSGLDAASARGMWDLILEAKKARCVILTSHSMHEVETLCERIGMIANGNLVCVGDLLDLKKKYSDGFKLKVTCEGHNEERVKSYMQRSLPFAEFVQKIAGGNLLYRIKSRAMKLSLLFENMQPMKLSQCGIKDWSLDEGGILETIFMKFAAGHDDEV